MQDQNLTEDEIQMLVVRWLQPLQERFGFTLFSIPNESKRSKSYGAKLKKMGLKPGAPDLVFCKDGTCVFVEMKAYKKYQTKEQKDFEAECDQIGMSYAVCRSLMDVLNFIECIILPPLAHIAGTDDFIPLKNVYSIAERMQNG